MPLLIVNPDSVPDAWILRSKDSFGNYLIDGYPGSPNMVQEPLQEEIKSFLMENRAVYMKPWPSATDLVLLKFSLSFLQNNMRDGFETNEMFRH